MVVVAAGLVTASGSASSTVRRAAPAAFTSTLSQPVVGIARAGVNGYWLGAADGGVFNFGGAPFAGSLGAQRLNRPVVGIAGTATGQGYWMAATDGGVFN